MSDLCDRHCAAAAPALAAADVRDRLRDVAGWRLEGDAIEKAFVFAGWLETIAFVNALAWLCQRQDHHPDLAVGHDRCNVRFTTHSAGGLTLNDFICAARADALVAPDA